MTRFGNLWNKIERHVIYLVLLLFILLELAALFIPSIRSILDNGGSLILIAMILFVIFRFIDEGLSKEHDEVGIIDESFGKAVQKTIDGKQNLETLDIFAHSSSKYYTFIRESKIHVRKLRLLVCNPDIIKSLPFPSSDAERLSQSEQIDYIISNWFRVYHEGMIESIEVHIHNFTPTCHFMIADRRSAQFGFFCPSPNIPGVKILTTFVAKMKNSAGRQIIQDLTAYFDIVFKDYSIPVEEADVEK